MRAVPIDRKSRRLNSSHVEISYAVFCLKKTDERRGPPPAGGGDVRAGPPPLQGGGRRRLPRSGPVGARPDRAPVERRGTPFFFNEEVPTGPPPLPLPRRPRI